MGCTYRKREPISKRNKVGEGKKKSWPMGGGGGGEGRGENGGGEAKGNAWDRGEGNTKLGWTGSVSREGGGGSAKGGNG